MFRCDLCNKNSKRCYKTVAEKRNRTYYNLCIENIRKRQVEYKTFNNSLDRLKYREELKTDIDRYLFKENNTTGWEIVKEEELCEECYVK